MSVAEDHYEAFATAAEDPYLGALLGTIDEPGGTSTANRAGMLTLAWWDEHGNGPTCAELIEAVFEIDDWDAAIEDPGRTLFERHEQRDLLQRWLISYWTRLGTIAFVPGYDDIVRPGRVDVVAEANRTESE
ncbi:hypothetical protein [Microbacterium sp. 5K110]|jgi:hypothetical protein|uniref:hypothetical protein n=1 Tax=unclassified Microbacterium TaxID=2609290 RepID=UPI0010FEE491|nr:hypothetical protein [Microbacterium sp. 5K110]TLF31774.1 hypothetical protein FE256_07085 [Microbacterium sp. 5K110]